jgi:glycosyltransferase involved in cell wall biosynthesis
MVENTEIMFVIGTLEIGGAEMQLATVARMLVRRGWRISIYSLRGGGPLQKDFEAAGATVIVPEQNSARSRYLVARVARLGFAAVYLFWTLLRRRPAIVHFFLPEAYLVGAPLALLARIPIRVMSRRSLRVYQERYPLLQTVEYFLHRTMAAILVNSRRIIDELMEHEHVPEQRLKLIYNGIDFSRFAGPDTRLATRGALGVSPAALVLVCVANLIPYKGHADLLSALGLIKGDMPADWCLFIVGRDDGIGRNLRDQAEAQGLAANIRFLGSRRDIPDILKAADIGLLCSHQEGFSNSVLEGMAAALPMIVTDVGGNPEAVKNGASGLVVPPRDPAGLAQAILRLTTDAPLRKELGDAARQRVLQEFTFERCIESYESVYRALIAGKTPADISLTRVAP